MKQYPTGYFLVLVVTMADEIRIGLAIESDPAGSARAQKELVDLKKRVEGLKGLFKAGALDIDTFTKEMTDAEKQARKLDKALDELGEKRRLDLDTGDLVTPKTGGAGAGLRQLGREGRNLPSVQIPGLGIGTDAISNMVRLSGAIVDASEKSKVATGAIGLLTPALGAQTAATVAAFAPIALLVGGLLVLKVAFDSLVESTSKNADRINSFAENQRDLNDKIAGGLTSGEAQEDLDRLSEAQERNRATLAGLKDAYDTSQQQLGLLGGVTKIFSGDEEALANQITETNKTINDQQAEMDALGNALNNGVLAANDAAEAEKDLAQQRTQGLLTDAQQAGELASLRERAADLTAEQIDKELESIDRRRVGIEAELAVLDASGNTSDEVAKKIAQLRDQLGFLGDEAGVLKATTPKADTREADKAAKEAQREQEKAAKGVQKAADDAARAQQTYSDKIRAAAQHFRDAVQDIGIGLGDAFEDNQRKLLDSANESAIEFNQDQLQEQRAYQRDLARIHREAGREELDATRARDFAALRDVREREADAISDRKRTEVDENAEQLIEQQQQFEALGRDRDLANRDARIDSQRAIRDARLDRSRANRDARRDLNDYHRDRANQEQTFMRSSLNNWNNYFQQLSRLSGYTTGGSTSGSTGGTQTRASTPSFDDFQYVFGAA